MVHPLIHNDKRTFHFCQMRNGILGQHCKTVGVDQFRDTVVDLRVHMVRTSGEDDTAFAGLL